MAKTSRKAQEQQLAQLNALRADPQAPAAREALRAALQSPHAILANAAANIVAEAELEGFEPALAEAFERFMQQPLKSDPGCAAKTSAARALYRLAAKAFAVFLRGIHHVQPEPVWGGTEDAAVELRGVCALGLIRGGYPEALLEAGELLADPEAMARVAAAQAIAYSERADIGLPLLRCKARLGDVDPRVTAACFSGLLALAPHGSLSFVAGFLQHADPATREAALIALGESRSPDALAPLCAFAEASVESELRATAFTAIALMRSDAAWDYLLSVVRDGGDGAARAAQKALAPYEEARLRARIDAAVAERGGERKLR